MGLGWARFWLEVALGGLATGRLLARSAWGTMDWRWLMEATALPRVGLLDGPECRGKAAQKKWHTAAGKHYHHCQSGPSPTLFLAGREKLVPYRTHFGGPCIFLLSSPKARFLRRVLRLISFLLLFSFSCRFTSNFNETTMLSQAPGGGACLEHRSVCWHHPGTVLFLLWKPSEAVTRCSAAERETRNDTRARWHMQEEKRDWEATRG